MKTILTNARLEARETAGVSKCNKKRCQLCNIIITGNKITFKPTNNDFYIKFNMTCNSTNVLYVIECQGCRKTSERLATCGFGPTFTGTHTPERQPPMCACFASPASSCKQYAVRVCHACAVDHTSLHIEL